MIGIEVIPKISLLLAKLIERVKDTKTASLVQQIQTFHQAIVTENANLLAENTKLKSENAELKKQLAKAQFTRGPRYVERRVCKAPRQE